MAAEPRLAEGGATATLSPQGAATGLDAVRNRGAEPGARGSLLCSALGVPKSAGAPGVSALPAELGWKGEPGRQAPFFRGVSRVCAWVLAALAAQA